MTIVNQNGESSKSTKHKTTDHQQEKIKEYKKNRTRNVYRNGQSVGDGFEMKPTEWYVPFFVIYKAGLEPTPYW